MVEYPHDMTHHTEAGRIGKSMEKIGKVKVLRWDLRGKSEVWQTSACGRASPFQLPALREGPTVTFRQTEDEEAILGWIPNPEGLQNKDDMGLSTKFTFETIKPAGALGSFRSQRISWTIGPMASYKKSGHMFHWFDSIRKSTESRAFLASNHL